MKRVGIVTINDNDNYGNRVQCYALQEYLKKLNVDPENIYNNNFSIRYRISINIKNIIKTIIGYNYQREQNKRYKYFKEFNKNINYSKYKIRCGKANKKLSSQYDLFLSGSDQVWNLKLRSISDAHFLTFAPKEKRNSYAASFGISVIEESLKDYYQKQLNNFNYISVREDDGKKLVKELTNRDDVEVLIDPTMLLDASEWEKVLKKPKQLKTNKYILAYFLGGLSKEKRKEIEKVAKKLNCEIIDILDKNSTFYQTGPSEFLYLEKNAELICTDSFHSSVFAVLFNRPFVIFDRENSKLNMNSRIETLISKLKLKNRKYEGKITEDNLNHDYKEAYKILQKERKKSEEYLKKVLKIN